MNKESCFLITIGGVTIAFGAVLIVGGGLFAGRPQSVLVGMALVLEGIWIISLAANA